MKGPANAESRPTLTRAARAALAAIAVLALLGAGPGCAERPDDGTKPQPLQAELPALELRDDTPNLMLTWVDDKGNTHVELRPGDVPAEGRPLVRVVVSDREDGTRDLFYVADLTQRRGDGGFTVRTMTRRQWEELLAKRREDYLAKTAPPPRPAPGPSGSAGPAEPPKPAAATGVTVIIYGASWCKPCHQAADHARAKGATVIMKDVEESPAAAAEMREKLEKSHQRGGAIPIIDVRGQILVGFNPAALDQAMARAAAGTVL